MSVTDGLHVRDTVTVELVECLPDPPVPATTEPTPATAPPDASPTTRAADATIEQTGAGPPPED